MVHEFLNGKNLGKIRPSLPVKIFRDKERNITVPKWRFAVIEAVWMNII